MKRNNSKEAYPRWARKMIFKIRRRIETTFSQLSEQLNVQVVRAKSFWGLKTRLQTKILAYNLCSFVNKLLGKTDDMAQIKNLVFQTTVKNGHQYFIGLIFFAFYNWYIFLTFNFLIAQRIKLTDYQWK